MAINSGFFNSVSGDRKYDAEDINKFFDGVITDGVLSAIGDTLVVVPSSGLQIAIGSGKAWFLRSWIENTVDAFLTISTPDVTYSRIDIIALDFDKSDQVRENDIIIIEGTPAASPVPPSLIDTATHLQKPLAHIQVDANETVIQAADITDKVGTVDCPFSTGITDLLVEVDDVTIELVSNELTVKDDGITQSKIGPSAVDSLEIAANAVAGSEIAGAAVDTDHLAPGAVTEVKIAAGAVTNSKIGSLAVGVDELGTNAVINSKIGDWAVDTNEIAADAINSTKIADNAINSEHYVDGSIDRAHLSADIIDGTKIANLAVNSEHIVAGAIDNAHMADNSIDSNEYVNGSIDRVHLAADIVDGSKIANDAINSEHYAAGSIDAEHLATNAVTGPKILADAITAAKIADNVINSEHYAAGSIDNEHLASNAVTLAKMADNSVDTPELVADSVTQAKIDAGAVGTTELANNAVDDTKVGNRVPQVYRREGGHATDWNVVGGTSYVPGAVRMQCGSSMWTGAAAASGLVTIGFTTPYSYPPIVLATPGYTEETVEFRIASITTTQFQFAWKSTSGNLIGVAFHWLSIGPE